MEAKFIKETNQQYSIREDGILVRHYNINKHTKEKKYNNVEIKGSVEKRQNRTSITFVWRINGNKICRTQGSLLVEYFDYKLCKLDNCSNKVYNKESFHCNECRDKNISDMYKLLRKESIDNISKDYVARKLGISISDLTDDMYNLYKINLKVKRLLSEKTGVHFNKFK